MSRILVCDGEQRPALAAVRSLGRAGHQVDLCSHSPRALAAVSRYVNRFITVPDPLGEPDGFVTAVRRLVEAWGSEVVLPVTEQSSLALLPARDQLGGAVVPGPDAAAFRRIRDKRIVLEEAAAMGIATPRQIEVASPAEAERLLADPALFPMVIKPTTSVRGGRRWAAHYADGPEALKHPLAELPTEAYPLLLQQRILGPGCGIFLLVWGGRTIATFAHRRLREQPPSGGASVYCESVAADPILVERSRALLDRFAWQGAAMVEYKVDAKTGTPYLMEVNGRLWGSLQLAIDAGVDFPALLVAAATGRPAAAPPTYRTGLRLRWLWGDVTHLLARLRHNAAVLRLPSGAPGRWRVLLDTLAWHPGESSEVWRWWDARPFLRDTADFLWQHLLRGAEGRPSRGQRALAQLRRAVDRWRHAARRAEGMARARSLLADHQLLFLCHGNICRSPFAAAVARQLLNGVASAPQVHSAGMVGAGRASPPESIAAAREFGIDLSTHQSQLAVANQVGTHPLVVVMDRWQRAQAISVLGYAPRDVALLGDFDPDPISERTIADPLGGSPTAYAACYARIERCVRTLVGAAVGATHAAEPSRESAPIPPERRSLV